MKQLILINTAYVFKIKTGSKALLFILLLTILVFQSKAQDGWNKEKWLTYLDAKLFYGLEDYSITAFLKLPEGAMIYSHSEEKVYFIDDAHIIRKEWEISTNHHHIEDPKFYFYSDKLVVLGSFVNKTSYWFDLSKLKKWKEREIKNPSSQYLKVIHSVNLEFNDYKLVLNENNQHPEILASLYAHKTFKKKLVYQVDLSSSSVSGRGNVIDFENYNKQLWVLDAFKRNILLFNEDFIKVSEKDINYLFPAIYLQRQPRYGQMIPIDAQLHFDAVKNILYLAKTHYIKNGNQFVRNTSIYKITTKENEVTLDEVFQKDVDLKINQIIGGKVYVIKSVENDKLDMEFTPMKGGRLNYVYEFSL